MTITRRFVTKILLHKTLKNKNVIIALKLIKLIQIQMKKLSSLKKSNKNFN